MEGTRRPITLVTELLDDNPFRLDFHGHFPPALDRQLALGTLYRQPTILDPKGGPVARTATPEQLKAKELEHGYYRLKLLKPAGFTQELVDPNTDKGIWIHLRCEDEIRNLCNIRIRVHLARTLKQDVTAKATVALNRFAAQYPNARVPKRPKNARWPGSKQALRLKMSGRLTKSGIVIQEEWVFIEHENGRIYEIQMTTYAGAQREFKKQIKAFWKSIRIRNS